MELNSLHKVRMLGIGGIGMSALARFLKMRGIEVSGYDRTATPLTAELISEGIPVQYEPRPDMLENVDMVIYTPAVPKLFEEFIEIEKRNIPLKKRAEVLGMISRMYKTIAVAGTHGKTSTSGLITHLLKEAGIDVTGFVGGIMNNYNTNFLFGRTEWMVVEADEFDRSFLQLSPDIAVITSMDADHLDIYGSHNELQSTFKAFANKIKPGGTLFLNNRLPIIELDEGRKTWTYGIDAGNFSASGLAHRGLGVNFDYHAITGSIGNLRLNLPGRYNVENAVAAISVAKALGASDNDIRKGLDTFKGIRRRFDIRYRSEEVVHIDDYAHHPEEISALIDAVRDMLPGYKMIAVFQPHLFSRTNDFHKGFAESLSKADAVILLEIYPAREEPMEGVSSKMIFDLIENEEKSLTDLEGLSGELKKYQVRPSVVLTIGAGNIDTKVEETRQLVSTW